MKFTREGLRDFFEYNDDEILLENSFRENNRLLINIAKENFEKVGETCESQTRKAVQMNYVA